MKPIIVWKLRNLMKVSISSSNYAWKYYEIRDFILIPIYYYFYANNLLASPDNFQDILYRSSGEVVIRTVLLFSGFVEVLLPLLFCPLTTGLTAPICVTNYLIIAVLAAVPESIFIVVCCACATYTEPDSFCYYKSVLIFKASRCSRSCVFNRSTERLLAARKILSNF